MKLSPELAQRMKERLPEILMDVAMAVGYLDGQQLSKEVQAQIDVIGGAAAEVAEFLQAVLKEVEAR